MPSRLARPRLRCTQVATADELEAALVHLLTQPQECAAQVERATRALEPHQGATHRTWQEVAPLLRPEA